MFRTTLARTLLLGCIAVATAGLASGCSKKKGTTTTAGGAEAPDLAAAGQATGEQDGVLRYGKEESSEGGTVATRATTHVHKGADEASTVLTSLGPGVNVDRKARRGNFTLVLWPSGPAKLSAGWVPTANLSDGPRPGTGVVPNHK